MLQLGLPELTDKLLCSVLDQRSASNRVKSAISSPSPLQSGVPQGSVLPPTLFITHTSDMPRPGNGSCVGIYYADDATHIVTSNGTLDHHDALVVREADRPNTSEKMWKI